MTNDTAPLAHHSSTTTNGIDPAAATTSTAPITAPPSSSTSHPSPITPTTPILILGAGIIGLTLSHALTRSSIPHRVFDRDASLQSRGPGWAVSIHWARPSLSHCLPPAVLRAVEHAQVCPGTNDIGRFLFLDLGTAVPRYEIPSAPLLRLNRGRFREVLAGGVEVEWGRRGVGWREVSEGEGAGAVEVCFEDGETVRGAMLVGADGANSMVRRELLRHEGDGEGWRLERLPIRMLGTTVRLSEAQFEPLRRIHPMLFQGCHPETNTFMWFSIISVPETNGTGGSSGEEGVYEGQVNVSWRVKHENEEVPEENAERVRLMQRLAEPFEERLRTLVHSLPEDIVVSEIRLQDWPAVKWPNHGRVTLIGDAAHAMTMYRGEACNHGIVDAQMLHDTILSIYKGEVSQADALDEFDRQVGIRTRDGVLLSRQACLDAHDFHALKNDSPLVSKRALIRTPGMDVSKRPEI